MGNYDLAIANYNRAVKIDPEEAEFYFNRGLAYDKLGLIMQTKTDYENALPLNPKDAEAHFTRALACEKAGKRSEATESFRGFLWSAPEGPWYGIC